MLQDCRLSGMRLLPVSRGEYRFREDSAWVQALLNANGLADAYVIPEGGGGAAGLEGFAELAQELVTETTPDTVFALAMGTGTSVAGLAAHLPAGARVWGFPVLPLPGIEATFGAGRRGGADIHVWHGMVDKSYGRLTPDLLQFQKKFELEHNIALDPVYTVKLLRALYELAEQGRLPRTTRIVALHSGGLQGRRGYAPLLNTALAA